MARKFMVNHTRRLLVVSSPLCGSTTLKRWFRENLNGADADRSPLLSPEAASRLGGYRRVFVVRDPFQRLVSFYAHWVVGGEGAWRVADEQGRFDLEGASFRDLIYTLDHLWARGLTFQHHLQPQVDRIDGLTFDDVVPVEDLDCRLRMLSAELGLVHVPQRLHRARYVDRPGVVADEHPAALGRDGLPRWPHFYDRELLEIAERVYADDLAFYRRFAGGRS